MAPAVPAVAFAAIGAVPPTDAARDFITVGMVASAAVRIVASAGVGVPVVAAVRVVVVPVVGIVAVPHARVTVRVAGPRAIVLLGRPRR